MKKFISFLFAILVTGSVMAAANPTESDLINAGYNTKDNVVLCVKFIGDATVCHNIYFVGTFSSWAESFAGCPKFEPLSGFDGWYVAQAPYSSGFQGKPIQAADDKDTFSWAYQPGTWEAWCHVDGYYANIYAGFDDESTVEFPYSGAYIYTIGFWKKHATPCSSQTRTITGERADWHKWGPTGDWTIDLYGEGYVLNLRVPGSATTPFGKFSTTDNTLSWGYLQNQCQNTIAYLQQVDATVGISGTQLVASATLQGERGDNYTMNLTMPIPSAQTKATVKGAVSDKGDNTDYYYYYLYVSGLGDVYVYTFGSKTGTFTVNDNKLVVRLYDNQNGNTYAASGSLTITEDSDGNVTITGTVLGCNSVEYTFDVKSQNPTNLSATQNSDNTVTLAWDTDPGVNYYYVEAQDKNGSWQQGWYVYPDQDIPVNGRHSVIFNKILDNGKYQFYVRAIDKNYNTLGYSIKEFEVKGIPQLGAATFSVLIPSDCCFDVSNGVWFSVDMGGTVYWMQAEDAGGRWFTKSFDVTTVGYKVQVLNQKNPSDWSGVHYSYSQIVTNDEAYYYLQKNPYSSSEAWYIYEGSSSMKDHSYIPTDAYVDVDGAKGTYTINLSYTDKAMYYRVYLYHQSSTDYEYYELDPTDEELTSMSRTYTITFATDQVFDRIEVWAYDYNYNRTCEAYVNNTTFTIPASEFAPNDLQANVHTDHTATLSWEANKNVYHYWVYVYYDGINIYEKDLYPGSTEPVNGRYSVEFDKAVGNGEYTVRVSSYDDNGNYLGEAEIDFTIDGIPALGSCKVRVLIPSGTNFDVSNGVWFWWWQPGENGQWVKAEDKGGRWYEATISNITNSTFQFLVQNKGEWNDPYNQSSNSRYITESSVCMKLTAYYNLYDEDCSAVDHDYSIKSVKADAEPGKVTFTITANEYAASYSIYHHLQGSSGSYEWLCGGSLDANHVLSGLTNGLEAGEYDYRIYIYDENGNSAASPYNGTMTIQENTFIPKNLTVTAVGGNAYEISWDVATDVDRYYVSCRDANGNTMLDDYYSPSDLTIVGGKYVLKTAPALVSGEAYCRVDAYAPNESEHRGRSSMYFDVTITDLGDVTVRVQIPSDNNMDISNGVWIAWRYVGNVDYEAIVPATAKSDRWYEASFTVNATKYEFFVLNESALSSNTQSSFGMISNEANPCYEQLYKPGGSYWSLIDAECNAPDHDYRIKKVTTASATGGEVTFTIEAKDYATIYNVYARKNGTSDGFAYIGYLEYNGKSTDIKATFFSNEDTDYDYRIYVFDRYGNYLADQYEGVVAVKKNPSVPTDLKATVAADGQTVMLKWTKDSQSQATYYYVVLFDASNDWERGEIPYVEGTTASIKLYVASDYYWVLYVYDSEHTYLGTVRSSDLFTITAKDLTPKNLSATVADQTVTLTWETEPEVTQCSYEIDCNTEGRYFYNLYATSTNGKYSVTFTPPVGVYGDFSWSVVASTENSSYYISNWVTGSDFTIAAPATPITETHTIKLNTTSGGFVNYISGSYPKGTTLELFAKPYDSYQFEKWSDGSKDATRTIVLTQDTILTAYFTSAYITHTVQVTAGEGGTVNNVSGTYPENTYLDLVATANSGYKFLKWSDGVTDAERTLRVYQDTVLVATFEKDGGVTPPPTPPTQYSFAYDKQGLGDVMSSEKAGSYDSGKTITLTATPATDWTFEGWSKDGGATTFSTSSSVTITLTENTSIIAIFKTTKKYKVTITAGSGGKVEPSDIKDKEYLGGSSIEITAKPNSGYSFVKWSDGNKQAKRTIVITQDTVLKATFEEVEKAMLRVEIMPDEKAGTVLFDGESVASLRQEVTVGSKVTLTAKAASGYVFVQFEDGSETIKTKDYEVTVNKSKTVTAVFKKEEQGLEEIMNQESGIRKVLINGEIYILRDDKVYTVHGQLVK